MEGVYDHSKHTYYVKEVSTMDVIEYCSYIDLDDIYNEQGYDALVQKVAEYILFMLTPRDYSRGCRKVVWYNNCGEESVKKSFEEICSLMDSIPMSECEIKEGVGALRGMGILMSISDIHRHYKSSVKREALMKVAGIEEQDCLVDNKRREM